MTLETFFNKFDQFADAPDAVAKMRELVLHLAVTGKLVDQDPSDEHAEALIAHIADQRRAKKAKEYQPVTAEEAPYELPFSWSWSRLGNISLSSDSGWSPQCLPESRTGTEWGVLKVSAVSWGVFKSEENKALPPGMTGRPDCEVKAGDFLLSRANTEELVARSVVVDQTPPRLMMSDKIVRFTFPDEIERAFINLANSSVHSRAYYTRNASGTSSSMKNIGREVMCNLPIPLPPLAEQKRIVAKVDELMALCDRLEAQQQERETRHAALARASLARFAEAPTPANLNYLFHSSFSIPPSDLRKSILTLAVQGKLVPQDPNDEPAEDSFSKLASMAVESDDDAFPAHWLRVPFGKTGEWRGGGTPSKSRPEFWKGDLPWVSPKDMKMLHIADAQDHISPAAVEGSSVRLIQPGSLLMVVRGMILARAFPVALTMREVTINQDMKALLPSEPQTKEYLLVALRAFEPDVLAAIEHSSHGTCKLKTEFLQDFVMPFPPLAEQRRIVAKVEQLMALVDALETQLAASRATAANLLSGLLAIIKEEARGLP